MHCSVHLMYSHEFFSNLSEKVFQAICNGAVMNSKEWNLRPRVLRQVCYALKQYYLDSSGEFTEYP